MYIASSLPNQGGGGWLTPVQPKVSHPNWGKFIYIWLCVSHTFYSRKQRTEKKKKRKKRKKKGGERRLQDSNLCTSPKGMSELLLAGHRVNHSTKTTCFVFCYLKSLLSFLFYSILSFLGTNSKILFFFFFFSQFFPFLHVVLFYFIFFNMFINASPPRAKNQKKKKKNFIKDRGYYKIFTKKKKRKKKEKHHHHQSIWFHCANPKNPSCTKISLDTGTDHNAAN